MKLLSSVAFVFFILLVPACSDPNSGASSFELSSSDLGNLVYGYTAQLSASLVIEEKPIGTINNFYPSSIFSGSEVTFVELFQAAEAHYLTIKNDLQSEWGLSGDLLHAAYLMNVVHWLWPIGVPDIAGNANVPVGCVFHNPYLTSADGPVVPSSGFHYLPEVTPAKYMSSQVACCNDFAMMLYIFLNMAGYETIQVGRPGHIYVQSKISSDTYVLDSMLNYLIKMNNVDVLNQKSISNFILFPFSASQKNKVEYFRNRFGALRSHYILLNGRAQLPEPITYDVLNHYDDWVNNNKVITGGY